MVIVKYASNSKLLKSNIGVTFPSLDLNDTSTIWNKIEWQIVTTIPVFHTFGRIETVALMMGSATNVHQSICPIAFVVQDYNEQRSISKRQYD